MTITETTGCTAAGVTFDGKPIQEVDEGAILDYLLPKVREAMARNELQLLDVVRLFQYSSSAQIGGTCEQCGDSVWQTTWEI